MPQTRKIRHVVSSKPTLEGAGVHLRRAFGGARDASLFDPFLLLDDFRNDRSQDYAPGFPWHPHRGIETITYMLRGTVAHGDSLGNQGAINAGDVQWMTAGNGILHQEMPQGDPDGRMYGFQLWANLPAASKMMDPRYQDVTAGDIPEVALGDGVTARVICGQAGGARGPVHNIVIDPQYLDVLVTPGTRFTFETPIGYTVFAYVYGGAVQFGDETDPFAYPREGSGYFDMQPGGWLGDHSLVLFGDGEQLVAVTGDQAARFLLVSGRPIHEPIAWYGPIVMNTEDELRQAFADLQRGTFIKKG